MREAQCSLSSFVFAFVFCPNVFCVGTDSRFLELTEAELQMKNLRTIINLSGNGIAMIESLVSVARLGVKDFLIELASILPVLSIVLPIQSPFCLSLKM